MTETNGLAALLEAGKKIIAKEVTVAGRKATVHFRRITGGQLLEILKGQKISRSPSGASLELDLALNEDQKHKIVLYSVVTDDGKPFFADLGQVKAADAVTVAALYEAASSIGEAPRASDRR